MTFGNKRHKKGQGALCIHTWIGMILMIIGSVLVIDELHELIPGSNIGPFLPDLSWVDGGNVILHHWMVGALLIFVGLFFLLCGKTIQRRKQ